MVQQTIETVYCRVTSALSESSIDKARIIGFEKIFADRNLRDPFHHLNSEYLQKQYYRDVLGLVISKYLCRYTRLVFYSIFYCRSQLNEHLDRHCSVESVAAYLVSF